jgi:hypothetical protein
VQSHFAVFSLWAAASFCCDCLLLLNTILVIGRTKLLSCRLAQIACIIRPAAQPVPLGLYHIATTMVTIPPGEWRPAYAERAVL